MGCEVINAFMHLLEEKFNNEGKNKFFSHQFFPTVLDEKMSRYRQKLIRFLVELTDLQNCLFVQFDFFSI
jgi:hypothetical protein